MRMRVPIQEVDVPTRADKVTFSENLLRKFNKGLNPFRLSPEIHQESKYYYSTEFDPMRKEMFLKKDPFFTTMQRLQMVWDTVQRLTVPKIKKKKKSKLSLRALGKHGMDPEKGTDEGEKEEERGEQLSLFSLREMNVYCAAYPLHDSETHEEPDPYADVDPRMWPSRKWLFKVWGNFREWKKYQPLDQIADYFGARTGLYFAWLGKLGKYQEKS